MGRGMERGLHLRAFARWSCCSPHCHKVQRNQSPTRGERALRIRPPPSPVNGQTLWAGNLFIKEGWEQWISKHSFDETQPRTKDPGPRVPHSPDRRRGLGAIKGSLRSGQSSVRRDRRRRSGTAAMFASNIQRAALLSPFCVNGACSRTELPCMPAFVATLEFPLLIYLAIGSA